MTMLIIHEVHDGFVPEILFTLTRAVPGQVVHIQWKRIIEAAKD